MRWVDYPYLPVSFVPRCCLRYRIPRFPTPAVPTHGIIPHALPWNGSARMLLRLPALNSRLRHCRLHYHPHSVPTHLARFRCTLPLPGTTFHSGYRVYVPRLIHLRLRPQFTWPVERFLLRHYGCWYALLPPRIYLPCFLALPCYAGATLPEVLLRLVLPYARLDTFAVLDYWFRTCICWILYLPSYCQITTGTCLTCYRWIPCLTCRRLPTVVAYNACIFLHMILRCLVTYHCRYTVLRYFYGPPLNSLLPLFCPWFCLVCEHFWWRVTVYYVPLNWVGYLPFAVPV